MPLEGGADRRRRHAPERTGHERALERRARHGDRDGLGARRARRGGQPILEITVDGGVRARDACACGPFFDPDGEQAALVSDLDFLSPRARRRGRRCGARRSSARSRGAPPEIARPLADRRRSRSAASCRRRSKRRRARAASRRDRGARPLRLRRRPSSSLEQLPTDRFAIDVSGGLAGLAVRGEAVMRRITDLDLDALPAAGAVAARPGARHRATATPSALWFAAGVLATTSPRSSSTRHEGLRR